MQRRPRGQVSSINCPLAAAADENLSYSMPPESFGVSSRQIVGTSKELGNGRILRSMLWDYEGQDDQATSVKQHDGTLESKSTVVEFY
jgi:hypothetical protein